MHRNALLWTVALAALCFAPLAKADDVTLADGKKTKNAASSKGSASKKKEKDDSSSGSGSRTSAEARTGHQFGVMAGGGQVVGSINGADVEGYWMPSPSMQVGLAYMQGSEDLGTLEDTQFVTDDFGINAKLIVARFRYFIGNTFNLSAVLGERLINAHATISSKTTTDQVKLDINSNSTVVGLTIGNHWTYDFGMTLGVDYVDQRHRHCRPTRALGRRPKIRRPARQGGQRPGLDRHDWLLFLTS